MNWLKNKAKNIAEFVYQKFEAKGSGNMILLTTMTGIALSSIAQTAAIILNNKYSVSQKAFMIPQELTEGCITILSILFVTTPLQKFSKKMVQSGKIYSKEMHQYMKKHDLFTQRNAQNSFDFSKCVTQIIDNVKKSDEFVKSSEKNKNNLLKEHNSILQDYDIFSDATAAIATTTGSVISTAVVSPFIRNYTASKYQQLNMNIYDRLPYHNKDNIKQNGNTNFKSGSYYYLNPCKF